MAKKLLAASGKGGVGKSTVSAAIGKALARKGKKTLLVDCDAGLPSLDIMLNCRENISFGWYDAFLGRCQAEECIVSPYPNLFLMASPRSFDDEAEICCIKNVVSQVENNYDYIIFDAPAGLGKGLLRAAAGAAQALIVATADPVSVEDAAKLAQELKKHGTVHSRLLINRYDVRAAKKEKLLTIDELIDKTFVRLLGIIPEDKNIIYSTVTGKLPRKSKSEKAFERIADRIDGINVDFSLSMLK